MVSLMIFTVFYMHFSDDGYQREAPIGEWYLYK
jgi:hypothetical protein